MDRRNVKINYFLDRRPRMMRIVCIIIAALIIIPSMLISLYTYPCQDDFHYAFYANETMSEGYSVLYTALIWTIRYYKNFCGCYTSSFLGFFFSGIINCSIWGIRIFEFFSALLFYFALYFFCYAFSHKIMRFPREKVLPFYCILLAMFNGLIYYAWHEAFYWFITSVQYLMISSFIISGVGFFILELCEEKKRRKMIFFVFASVLGVLGSGGTLSIAAFCCVIYLIVTIWGIVERGRFKDALYIMAMVLSGAIINGIAPGNYVRAGSSKGIEDILYAGKMSLRYTIERWELLVKNPFFWIILILFCIILFSSGREQGNYSFYAPGVFVLGLFGAIACIIFPAVLGYSYETYGKLMRGNFISDSAFFLYIFMAVFYIKGWLDYKYQGVSKKFINKDTVYIACFILVALLIHERNDWKQIPFVREYRELVTGKYDEYSKFCVDIYEKIEMCDGEIAEVHTDFVEDVTCLVNPQFFEGMYNPEDEYANRTIARFYGKKAIYIYYD